MIVFARTDDWQSWGGEFYIAFTAFVMAYVCQCNPRYSIEDIGTIIKK